MKDRGYTLVEVLLALALAAALIPAFLGGISVGVRASDRAQDRATMYRLAQAQMEDVLRQPYDPLPASYSTLSDIPEGYSVQITATVPIQYQYVTGSSAPEAVQAITVRVDGPFGYVELQGYKVRE